MPTQTTREPRIFHFRGGTRVITICYSCDENALVRYGATVFKYDEHDRDFTRTHRKNSIATATKRFNQSPINLTVEHGTHKELLKGIRQAVAEYGCCFNGPRMTKLLEEAEGRGSLSEEIVGDPCSFCADDTGLSPEILLFIKSNPGNGVYTPAPISER